MKTYFCKYLPVKEKIKNGDKVQYKTGEIVDYVVPLNTDNLTKVKLFLCSRDIQVGDRYFKNGSDEKLVSYLTYWEQDGVKQDILSHELWYMGTYKVLGEISLEATWVKEGDEFERNDFQMRWTNSKGENSLTKKDVDTEENDPKLVAYIKCPTCKTFH